MKLSTCSCIYIYININLYIAYIYSENVSCLFYIKMSTVLITVQIPFYHFCTVCCTGDLVLLLDDRKGSILFSASWLFHGARSPGCPKRKTCGNGGPCSGPRCRLPTTTPGRGGAEAPLEAVQSAMNSQGSCFLSWCHLPVSVRRAVGHKPPTPFPSLPSSSCCCF